jgi:hypothetical protein
MDREIRAALTKIIALDEQLCSRGTRMLRAAASEAEDVLARLPPGGDDEPETVAADPSRELLLRADPSATVAFYPLADGKLRLSCGAWEDSRVILADEVAEFGCQRGQVVAAPISLPSNSIPRETYCSGVRTHRRGDRREAGNYTRGVWTCLGQACLFRVKRAMKQMLFVPRDDKTDIRAVRLVFGASLCWCFSLTLPS